MSAKRTKGLYKYRDSKTWGFRYTDPFTGKRKAVSLGTDDEGTAVYRARAILGGIMVAKADEIDREIDEYLIGGLPRNRWAHSSVASLKRFLSFACITK